MSMERYAEALQELEVVRDNVPKESAVYFLMGKVIGRLSRGALLGVVGWIALDVWVGVGGVF